MLLLDFQSLFSQTMSQGVLVDFLQVAVPMIPMDSKTGFANHIAKLHDVFHKVTSFISLCAFCAFSWLIPVIRPVFLSIATKTHKRHKIKNGLANHIAKLPDEIHKPSAFISFCAFCAFSWLVHIPGYFFRFVFVAVFLAAGFFVFFSGLLAAFLTFSFTVLPAWALSGPPVSSPVSRSRRFPPPVAASRQRRFRASRGRRARRSSPTKCRSRFAVASSRHSGTCSHPSKRDETLWSTGHPRRAANSPHDG